MGITQALFRSFAAMVLVAVSLLLMPSPARAHAGHGHAAAPMAQSKMRAPSESLAAAAQASLSQSQADQVAGPCTANCCAAGMGCCAALIAEPDEIDPPEARRASARPLAIAHAGIDPGVPLKPPRSAVGAHTIRA